MAFVPFQYPPLWSKHHFIFLTCTICLCTIYPPHSHPALQTLLHNSSLCFFSPLLPPFFVLFFFPSTVLQYLVTFATPSKSSRLSPLHCSLNFISETTTKRHIHNVPIPHSQLPLTEEHIRTQNIYWKVTTSACHFRMFYSVNPHLLVIHEQ